MRLKDIKVLRDLQGSKIQPLPSGDYSSSVGIDFYIRPPPSLRRRIIRAIALRALQSQQVKIRKSIAANIDFPSDLVSIGERFANDAAWALLMRVLPSTRNIDVLVPGCYMAGEDIQFWLRYGVRRLAGFDIFALDRHWCKIVPELEKRWPTTIDFRQASIEALPYPDASFDVLVSDAVLEHVRNIEAMTAETARVVKPGGLVLHAFGPLYYSFGADHCIAAYGSEAGYDHLLLDEATYRARIGDHVFFTESARQPDLAFWALNDQFSFGTAADYLTAFSRYFDALLVIAKISPEALAYRSAHSKRWRRLTDAGVQESDLLVKGLAVVLRRRAP